jgi:hypothetical protein
LLPFPEPFVFPNAVYNRKGINRTVILLVDVYGCETWFPTLREEHRLRVFENRVLREVFGPKGDEVTGGWGKLHNEELRKLCCSPSITRSMI